MNTPRVLFVCGLGGAGKTTYAQKLLAQTPGAVLVSHDWYLRDTSNDRHRKLDEAIASGDGALSIMSAIHETGMIGKVFSQTSSH